MRYDFPKWSSFYSWPSPPVRLLFRPAFSNLLFRMFLCLFFFLYLFGCFSFVSLSDLPLRKTMKRSKKEAVQSFSQINWVSGDVFNHTARVMVNGSRLRVADFFPEESCPRSPDLAKNTCSKKLTNKLPRLPSFVCCDFFQQIPSAYSPYHHSHSVLCLTDTSKSQRRMLTLSASATTTKSIHVPVHFAWLSPTPLSFKFPPSNELLQLPWTSTIYFSRSQNHFPLEYACHSPAWRLAYISTYYSSKSCPLHLLPSPCSSSPALFTTIILIFFRPKLLSAYLSLLSIYLSHLLSCEE